MVGATSKCIAVLGRTNGAGGDRGVAREAVQQEYACLCKGKKMKFSSVLFLWQIQLLWGLVQSGVASKRQKLKT